MIPVHERIRLYMYRHDISQKSVAIELKWSPAKISAILSGARRLNIDDYQRICAVLHVDPCRFLEKTLRL